MIIIVPAEITEVGTVELLVWEDKPAQDLRAGAVAAAVIGKLIFEDTIKTISV
jgi:hypothetical protein